MSENDIPWSVPVRLDDVGKGYVRKLVADAATRARIAEALELPSIEALEAELEVRARFEGGDVRGRLDARVEQVCGVTLEPFMNTVSSDFDRRFTTREPEPPAPGEEMSLADLDAPEYLPGAEIDLGAIVVEELSLALDPFPKKPDAVFEQPEVTSEPSPFAALAVLKRETPPG